MRLFRRCTILLIVCASLAQAQTKLKSLDLTFTTIDVPGAAATEITGINQAGDMVGNYYETLYDWHAFKLSGETYNFFDYPDAEFTRATGINDSGLIVGYGYPGKSIGFLYDGAKFRTIRHRPDLATFTE